MEPATSAQGNFPLPHPFVRPLQVYSTIFRNLICMNATIVLCFSEQASGQADLQSDFDSIMTGAVSSKPPH